MKKQVLDVGNCAPDHTLIRRMIEKHFGALVHRAHRAEETLELLRREVFHLVLVNRKLDIDSSDGLGIIRQIKADPALCQVPVMLVTNYSEYQRKAVASGAELGFGKSALNDPGTVERLRPFLS